MSLRHSDFPAPGNRRSPATRGIAFSSAIACFERGTSCSRFVFVRSGGIVQIAPLRSNSDHRAPLTSADLVAVRTSSFRAHAAGVQRSLSSCQAKSASFHGIAGW